MFTARPRLTRKMGLNKIRVNRNRANRGQCYVVMVPQKAKNHAIPKIRAIVRPMLCNNGSTRAKNHAIPKICVIVRLS